MKLTVLIKNQCLCIIQNNVSDGVDINYNGEKLLLDILAPNCNSFADVGANTGEWTEEFLLSSNNHIVGHLFEPNPEYYNILSRKYLHENLHLHNISLSSIEGSMPFKLEGRSSRIANFDNSKNKLMVRVKTLDNILKKERIDYIKIDCEGHDFEVIKGAHRIISQKRCKYIQFEYNDFWLECGSSLYQAMIFFSYYKFSLYRIQRSGLKPLIYTELGDYYRYSNYLAIQDDLYDDIKPIII